MSKATLVPGFSCDLSNWEQTWYRWAGLNSDYGNNLLPGSFQFFKSLNIPKMFPQYKNDRLC